jgi:cyanophycinase-like exopeptidase
MGFFMALCSQGPVALLGSGETAPASGVIYERFARRVDVPLCVAILETPAGFQPNATRVAAKIADFLATRLQNYQPRFELLPARRRGTGASPDDPATTERIREADMIFLGPGSPTYTVQQLTGSLAWQRLLARQRRGASLVTASAATVAMGAYALPVYEIYKVGSELHWQRGLDFFGAYGLRLVFVPHWNNSEGGADLDTARCYMGEQRFKELCALLPEDVIIVGIDEHTGLVFDFSEARGEVLGKGSVTLIGSAGEQRFERNSTFPLQLLGPFQMPEHTDDIPLAVWEEMDAGTSAAPPPPPDDVLALVEARQAARARRDWPAADKLRAQLLASGWDVRDTPSGPVVARQ